MAWGSEPRRRQGQGSWQGEQPFNDAGIRRRTGNASQWLEEHGPSPHPDARGRVTEPLTPRERINASLERIGFLKRRWQTPDEIPDLDAPDGWAPAGSSED